MSTKQETNLESIFQDNQQVRIEIDKDFISLYPSGNSLMSHDGYNIERSRCLTPGLILGWVNQLSHKCWMDRQAIATFTMKAFKLIGVDVDYKI